MKVPIFHYSLCIFRYTFYFTFKHLRSWPDGQRSQIELRLSSLTIKVCDLWCSQKKYDFQGNVTTVATCVPRDAGVWSANFGQHSSAILIVRIS